MPNKRKVEGPYSVTLKSKFAFYACQNIALSNSPHYKQTKILEVLVPVLALYQFKYQESATSTFS